jgi:integrating conjugative element protein (TIGR03759 family)
MKLNLVNSILPKTFLVLVFALPSVSQAQKNTPSIVGLTVSETDALFGGITEIKENDWENWGLTKEEWDRYLIIKDKTMWATWDGNPSPLQLLAIYSQSIEQKRHYAQIEARLDRWRLDAAMTYQQIYTKEANILGAKYAAFMKGRTPSVENIKPGERVLIFVNAASGECNTRCLTVVKQIMRTGANINIYSVDKVSQEKLFAWATSADIPVDKVQSGEITLNFEGGEFAQVSEVPAAFAIIPATYVQRDSGWVRVIQ